MNGYFGNSFTLLLFFAVEAFGDQYYGKLLGRFPSVSAHNVQGLVYAPNDHSIFIQGFTYDGAGPDAFFWAGSTPAPSPNGFIIPDELGRMVKLNSYNNQSILLTLPEGRKLRDISWIAVWCRMFQANFGHIFIPYNFDPPRPLSLGRIETVAHGTSAQAVIIKDTKTLEVLNLYYDGAGPDAFFLVGKGDKPHSNAGSFWKVPDENGRTGKLDGYNGKNITLRLPDDITMNDIEWFGLFCIRFQQNFGNVRIPRGLNVPADLEVLESSVVSFSNCETIFRDEMQVSWEVRKDDIYFQLEGVVEPDHYMAFGLSGNPDRPQMIGADVTLAFYDSDTKKGAVVDYILTDKSQCAPQSRSGVCPDTVISGGKQDSELVSWSYADGVVKVAYRRPLKTDDDNADQIIAPDSTITWVAAIGPLNSHKEAAYHRKRSGQQNQRSRLSFNRPLAQRNCAPLGKTNSAKSSRHTSRKWKQAVIENEVQFIAQIGPSGGPRGYTGITGIESWGIAWWINGELIPEIHVKRGTNYTFIVEGGKDPSNQAKYHPFYITNNKEGGGGQRSHELNTPDHIVYAGVSFHHNGPDPSPGSGRYCEWTHKSVDMSEKVSSLEEYKSTLHLECQPDEKGAVLYWTPDENTPDVVYYQCYTHRNLGWKIIVSGSHIVTPSLLTFVFISILSTLGHVL